jgi:hypothetical protein
LKAFIQNFHFGCFATRDYTGSYLQRSVEADKPRVRFGKQLAHWPQPDEDTAGSKVFSPLPSHDSRIANMGKAIQELTLKNYSANDEFPRIQREVRRLTPN